MATFGEKIKAIRNHRKMSQDDLANVLNTTKQVISRYETNQRTPKITVAQEFSILLNVDLLYLIDDSIPSDVAYSYRKVAAPTPPTLSSAEMSIALAYRRASDDDRIAVEAVLRKYRDEKEEAPPQNEEALNIG